MFPSRVKHNPEGGDSSSSPSPCFLYVVLKFIGKTEVIIAFGETEGWLLENRDPIQSGRI